MNGGADVDLPAEAYAAALVGLSGMAPRRSDSLLRRYPPEQAWHVAMGRHPDDVVRSWWRRTPGLQEAFARSGAQRPPAQVWERCHELGVRVLTPSSAGYPTVLAGDHEAPAVLFARGDPGALDGRRVGVVGTRNATEGGRRLAVRMGGELADAGIRVVSGLARGIDGCVHRGVLAVDGAPPVGVVACGHDVAFPKEHASLWDAVAERGLLLSEHPPGTPPLPDHFPARNRIIAALSEVVVVVESRSRGGSLVTARMAADRGIPVLAVPGSLLNRAAEGTNRLIADGCTAALDTLDVLVALGLETGRTVGPATDRRVRPARTDRAVLDAFDGDPLTLDQLLLRTGKPLAEVALAVGRLEAGGWLAEAGGWFEPVGAPVGR